MNDIYRLDIDEFDSPNETFLMEFPKDVDPETIAKYLEDEFDITHDDGNHYFYRVAEGNLIKD